MEEVDFDGFSDCISGCIVQLGSSEPDGIRSLDAIVLEQAEWRYVLGDAVAAADHGEASDSDVLVDHHPCGDEGIVADFYASAQEGCVGDDDIVADLAIVPQVRECHQEDIVSDDGGAVFLGSPVDGHVFADRAVLADLKEAFFIVVVEILRRISEYGTGVDLCVFADGCVSCDVGVRPDLAVVSDDDIFVNDGEWSDGDIGADFRAWRDSCSLVNHGSEWFLGWG